jgi:hypothetical protein
LVKKVSIRICESTAANGNVVEAVKQVEDSLSTGHAIIKSSAMSKEDLVLLPNGNSSQNTVETLETTSIPKNRSFDLMNW